MSRTIRIATRASRLALWQAEYVADRLRQADSACQVDLVRVTTQGDSNRTTPLSRLGGAGTFTREVQNAVLDSRADLAVHSLKDLPTDPVDGLVLAAVPERGSCFDVLVLPKPARPAEGFENLALQARVGTGSLRRRAQLWHHRPDLQMLDVRGNVETRLDKLDRGEYDALVLAAAGLERIGLEARISCELRPPVCFPAVGQGALGIECRSDDETTRTLLEQIGDPPTERAVAAERRLLAALRAGCHAPLGVWTRLEGKALTVEAVVLSHDGQQRLAATETGPIDQPDRLGRQVAEQLQQLGADRLIAQAREAAPLDQPPEV